MYVQRRAMKGIDLLCFPEIGMQIYTMRLGICFASRKMRILIETVMILIGLGTSV